MDKVEIVAYLALATATVTLMTAFIGVVNSFRNKKTLQQLTVSVDGRLTELLELTSKASHAEGMKEEKDSTK